MLVLPFGIVTPFPVRFISDASSTPKRMETALELKLAAAISCIPSPLKSPVATYNGSVPTRISVVPPKPPCPSPKRMETVLETLFAVAIS